MSESLLRLEGIVKSFHGVQVLRSVSFDVSPGEVLGIVGENGAGKSTLMNIIGGVLEADAGQMTLAGARYSPQTARDAQAAAIAFIHQELNLFPNLTIAENIFLTRFPLKSAYGWGWGRIDRRAMYDQAARLLEQVGLAISPNHRVDGLSAGERRLVEIAKALAY